MDFGMSRLLPTACLLVALLAPAAHAACPGAGPTAAEPGAISSRAEFARWMEACPQLFAPLGELARERFLEDLEFNDRGVTAYPVGELEEALTKEEIALISTRLGLAGLSAGLSPEEAARLRGQPRPAVPSTIERKYDRFARERMRLEADPDGAGNGAALLALYRTLFEPELGAPLRAHDAHDLGLLFRAVTSVASYGEDRRLLADAVGLYQELSRRGLATRSRAIDLMELLLEAGRVEQARDLATQYPGLPVLPRSRAMEEIQSARTIWDLETEPELLVERQVGPSPVHVVAHVSLGCAFSRAAMEAISRDPELGPVFRSHGTWVVPARELTGYARLRQWNRDNEATPLTVMTSWGAWPMLDRRESVPAFHVFRDVALVETVSGWPVEEGNREALLAALERAGYGL